MTLTPRSHHRRSAGGFTLVELLVVIGIIALLISILLPTLNSARRSANSVACLSNQRQLGIGIAFFADEHKQYLPKAWYNDTVNPSTVGNTEYDWGYRDPLWGWDFVLADTIADGDAKDVFKCPADSSDIIRTQTAGKEDDIPASYRYNTSNQPAPWSAMKRSELGNATKAILIADGNASYFHHLNSNEGTVASGSLASLGAGKEAIANAAPFRHSRDSEIYRNINGIETPVFKLNAAFADGHGETVTWNKTWELVGEPVNGIQGNSALVGVPTMWRQEFRTGWIDSYDNPNTTADDGNPFPG